MQGGAWGLPRPNMIRKRIPLASWEKQRAEGAHLPLLTRAGSRNTGLLKHHPRRDCVATLGRVAGRGPLLDSPTSMSAHSPLTEPAVTARTPRTSFEGFCWDCPGGRLSRSKFGKPRPSPARVPAHWLLKPLARGQVRSLEPVCAPTPAPIVRPAPIPPALAPRQPLTTLATYLRRHAL